MTKLEQQLERIRYRATRYELVARNGDKTYLLQYTGRGRRALLDAARKRGSQLVKLTGKKELTFGKRAGDGATMGDWRIEWTGRTQREAICAGEYEFLE